MTGESTRTVIGGMVCENCSTPFYSPTGRPSLCGQCEEDAGIKLTPLEIQLMKALEGMFAAVANARSEEHERAMGNPAMADRHASALEERLAVARAAYTEATKQAAGRVTA